MPVFDGVPERPVALSFGSDPTELIMRGVLISVQAQSRISLLRSLLVAAFLMPSATLAINIYAQTLDTRARSSGKLPNPRTACFRSGAGEMPWRRRMLPTV